MSSSTRPGVDATSEPSDADPDVLTGPATGHQYVVRGDRAFLVDPTLFVASVDGVVYFDLAAGVPVFDPDMPVDEAHSILVPLRLGIAHQERIVEDLTDELGRLVDEDEAKEERLVDLERTKANRVQQGAALAVEMEAAVMTACREAGVEPVTSLATAVSAKAAVLKHRWWSWSSPQDCHVFSGIESETASLVTAGRVALAHPEVQRVNSLIRPLAEIDEEERALAKIFRGFGPPPLVGMEVSREITLRGYALRVMRGWRNILEQLIDEPAIVQDDSQADVELDAVPADTAQRRWRLRRPSEGTVEPGP